MALVTMPPVDVDELLLVEDMWMADVRGVLTRAGDLVEVGWCQRTDALDADGLRVDWYNPLAVRFCARGALRRAAWEYAIGRESPEAWEYAIGRESPELQGLAVAAAARVLPPGQTDIAEWNDSAGRRQEEVVEAFRRAAA